VLECWSVGVLECWSVGVLECWSRLLDRQVASSLSVYCWNFVTDPHEFRGGAVLGVALKAWLTEGFAPRKFLEPVAFNAISLSLPAAGFVTGPRAEPSPAPQDLLRGAGNRVTTPPRSLVELAYRPSRQWAALAIEPLARAGGETGD
jgi:hypothetical protein